MTFCWAGRSAGGSSGPERGFKSIGSVRDSGGSVKASSGPEEGSIGPVGDSNGSVVAYGGP